MKTSVGSPIKVSSVSSLSEMSIVQGLVGEKPVEVLRDTGCSGVIVSKVHTQEQVRPWKW